MLDPAARGGDPAGQSRLQTPQGTPLGPRLCSHVVFTSFGRPKLKRSKSVGSPGNGGKVLPVTVESMSTVRPPLLSTPAARLPEAVNPVSLILLRCERNPVEPIVGHGHVGALGGAVDDDPGLAPGLDRVQHPSPGGGTMETKEFPRWTAKRKVELLLQLIRGERGLVPQARQHPRQAP